MAINKITGKSIKDLDLSADDLAPGTITDAKIATGTIANNKLANTSITINGTSIALGASGEIVAGTDWQAPTVADGSTELNTEAGKGYFLDTNAGVIEVKLPTSPTRGDTVILVDYAGTFATNNVLVNTGTTNLDSTTSRVYKIETNDTIAEFVYVDSAKGWITRINTTAGTTPTSALIAGQLGVSPQFTVATGGTITTSGDYKIHTFTGDDCFAVSQAGNVSSFACTPLEPQAGPNTVDYLVIAGGGGGGGDYYPGNWRGAGGGGAGGYREGKQACCSPHTASPLAATTGLTISATSYPVTVGAGGNNAAAPTTPAGQGSDSIFSTITSAGGGRGGSHFAGQENGNPGGSGAGSPNGPNSGPKAGGTGNTPPVSPPQGNNGGAGSPFQNDGGDGGAGGGGGGAGGAGTNASGQQAGPGGSGSASSINGTPTTRAGGGGGGGGNVSGGSGGPGGGGNGSNGGQPATANTGSGGGAAVSQDAAAGAGGKGIVILRYKFQ